jgi:hypothetical protein
MEKSFQILPMLRRRRKAALEICLIFPMDPGQKVMLYLGNRVAFGMLQLRLYLWSITEVL